MAFIILSNAHSSCGWRQKKYNICTQKCVPIPHRFVLCLMLSTQGHAIDLGIKNVSTLASKEVQHLYSEVHTDTPSLCTLFQLVSSSTSDRPRNEEYVNAMPWCDIKRMYGLFDPCFDWLIDSLFTKKCIMVLSL